jgi:hypothetical protein
MRKSIKVATPEQEEKVKKFLQKCQSLGKPSKIAASFSKIEELQPIHIEHFRSSEYLWKSMSGTIFAGVWVTDNINYIHQVLATQDVLDYLLTLSPNVNETN